MRWTPISLIIISTSFGRNIERRDFSLNMDGERLQKEAQYVAKIKRNETRQRPLGHVLYGGFHRPVVVAANIHIKSIDFVNDLNMEFRIDLYFRQIWKDPRMLIEEPGLDKVILSNPEEVWTPDTFFPTEVTAYRHIIDKPNVLVRIERDGTVLYSTRLTMLVSCPMDFSKFPFDNQTCSLPIESYGFTEEDIVYVWDRSWTKQREVSNPIPVFELTNITYDKGTTRVKPRNYSFIRVHFHFKRLLGYYILQVFIPTAMLVIASWTAFFIYPSKATARITLGVILLCTLTTFVFIANLYYPRTAYVRAIDIWFGVSLCFVFFALIESIITTRLYATCDHVCCNDSKEEQLITAGSKWHARRRKKNLAFRTYDCITRRPLKNDLISSILFPVLFLAFAVIYFIAFAFVV